MSYVATRKNWADRIDRSLWFKLELLNKNETWVVNDQEFLVLIEVLMTKIANKEIDVCDLILDERFPALLHGLAIMEASLMLRFAELASSTLAFDIQVLRWSVDNQSNPIHERFCNVIIARYNWIVSQQMKNQIFTEDTRKDILYYARQQKKNKEIN